MTVPNTANEGNSPKKWNWFDLTSPRTCADEPRLITVWIDPDGFEWTEEPIPDEACELTMDLSSGHCECHSTTWYVGRGGGRYRSSCADHFEIYVKPQCTKQIRGIRD